MRLNVVALLVVTLGCLSLEVSKAQTDQCTTPKQQLGDCKNIKQCPALLQLLNKRPLSASNADFLRRSQCGFEGTDPKVCCPLTNNENVQTTPKPSRGDSITVNKNPAAEIRSNLLPNKTVCGINAENRIYGGEVTELDEFPWMALVEYQLPDGSRGFYCGGVLISKRYVLTAAHCLKGKALPRTWRLVGVRLGEYNTDTDVDCVSNGPIGEECSDPPQNIPVEDRIAHEEYDPQDQNQYNDIALLRLSREAKFNDYTKPICLPTTTEELGNTFEGERLFVAGWGKTENSSESNIKLKVQVPVKSLSDCAPIYSGVRVRIGEGQICAGGEKGRDSCRGDSGGPLMTIKQNKAGDSNWYAAGIVSFGPTPCGFENWPGIYTRVSNYVQWIVSKLKP